MERAAKPFRTIAGLYPDVPAKTAALFFFTGLDVVLSLPLGPVINHPFYQFIHPFGFLSRIAERISLYRVKADHDTRTEYGNCVRSCPIETAKG